MKRLFSFAFFATFAVSVHAQNWATVSGSNITDLNQRPLAAGQICFLVTDQNDRAISVSIGGGGQTLRRPYCSAVANGAITGFTVPNPATTLPSGIYYRVTVKDTTTGQEVLRYSQVTFSGTTFNFDNYAPVNLGSFAPLSGNSVSGNLSVAGDGAFTGNVTGSNIPSLIPGTGSCANQFVTALNVAASPTCTTDMLASALHANQGTATTLLHGNAAGNPSWAAVSPSDTTGTTGSGNFVLATSPTLTTPNIRTATGTSLNLSGTGILSTTAQSGTGSICMTTSCVMTTPNIGAATATTLNGLSIPGSGSNLVSDTATQTLTNKSLGGSGSTTPNTNFNRLVGNRGTALVAGDVVASAGWGSTAAVSVSGTDSAGLIQVTANGTGIAANPTVTLTYHDGAWSVAPTVVCSRTESSAPTTAFWSTQGSGPTTVQFNFLGTPISGNIYRVSFFAIGD